MISAKAVALALALSLCLLSCGGGPAGPGAADGGGNTLSDLQPGPPLAQAEVQSIAMAAAASVNTPLVIAVVDRWGDILAIYAAPSCLNSMNQVTCTAIGNFGNQVAADELAVSLARTGAFFSNNQAPLSSRTVRFISGVHFPPGVDNAPNAALYGIENTNRGCLSKQYGAAVPQTQTIQGTSGSLGITTGKADVDDSDANAVDPGGVPIFKNDANGAHVAGGIGIAVPGLSESNAGPIAEYSGIVGANIGADGIAFPSFPSPGVVTINGITLPFVEQTTLPSGVGPGTDDDYVFTSGPIASPQSSAEGPSGCLIGAQSNGTCGMNGKSLSAANVNALISNAIATAQQTRAQIRLPLGSGTRMSISVSDLDGTILGLYRMFDGTVFSVDVAATKARNVVYFSSTMRSPNDLGGNPPNGVPIGIAVTNRTIGFGAQPFFPPGINATGSGPFFSLYTQDVANPCTEGSLQSGSNLSGIVFFPGSEPLYDTTGNLIGGLGASGDGVDQDDYVTAGGVCGPGNIGNGVTGCPYEAPAGIQAETILLPNSAGQYIPLPYLEFPRNPTQ
jgi:uncharacterized protein GlcG (DUF336 family)